MRERTDEQLLALLQLRPDLALPVPSDLGTLATRIGVRSSVARCLDGLDAFALRVLEAVIDAEHADPVRLLDDFAPDTTTAQLQAGLDRLFARALLWSDGEDVQTVPAVVELIGPFPAGLGQPAARLEAVGFGIEELLRWERGESTEPVTARRSDPVSDPLADPEVVEKLVAARPPDEHRILEMLAQGPPIGSINVETAAGLAEGSERGDPVVRALVAAGLLVQIAVDAVELPREVGVALRGGRPYAGVPAEAPPASASIRPVEDIDATASVAVLEILRLVESLATSFAQSPPAQLRSGGLSVRDLRRIARELDLREDRAGVVIELAVAADLVAAPTAREVPWLPTTDFDTWRQRDPAGRWVRLAQAWLTMTRQPHLIGQRDERGKARTALSYEIERSAAPAVRAEVLRVLLESPDGSTGTPELVLARLGWLLPRRMHLQHDAMGGVLDEAEFIGITGAGGLSSYGRAVVSGHPATAVEALTAALPAPVAEFLLQPDLTAIVPGPPTPDLAVELALLADLESAGGASVYRITETSMRRAFDAGRSAADVHALLSARSRTPVPQALTYLIDDLARRYGVLRAGEALAYLRSDDPALLDRALSDRAVSSLGWQRLAPTVAVSNASTDQVLDALRTSGQVPAHEDRAGVAITQAPAPTRARPKRSEPARPVTVTRNRADQYVETVRRMRTGDELARTAHLVTVRPDVPGVTSASTLAVLRDAIRTDRRVWVSFVDSTGTPSTTILAPLSLGGGFLRGHDVDTQEFRSVQLHRITSVNVLSS